MPHVLHACDNPDCDRVESVPHTFKHCSHCVCTWYVEAARNRCSVQGSDSLRYCSKECQAVHWHAKEDSHRHICKFLSRHVYDRRDTTKQEAYDAPWYMQLAFCVTYDKLNPILRHDLRYLRPSEVHAAFGLDKESIKNFAARVFPT